MIKKYSRNLFFWILLYASIIIFPFIVMTLIYMAFGIGYYNLSTVAVLLSISAFLVVTRKTLTQFIIFNLYYDGMNVKFEKSEIGANYQFVENNSTIVRIDELEYVTFNILMAKFQEKNGHFYNVFLPTTFKGFRNLIQDLNEKGIKIVK